MWFSFLCKIKVTTAWEGEKDLSRNEICRGCCRKGYPWTMLCERRVVRIQGMQSVLSIFSPLYNLLFEQLFHYIIGPFSPQKILHCPTSPCSHPLLKGRTPWLPFSILQACTDSHIFTTISTFIQYYDHNSIDLRFYFLMLIFFSIHENHLTDPEHSKHLRHLLNVFFRLQLMRYSICIWEIRDC